MFDFFFKPKPLPTVRGNLLDLFERGEFDTIVHGCNCFNSMGGGIAAQIAQRYPLAEEADKKTVSGDISKLGHIHMVETDYGWVINGYTQYNPGADVCYDAIDQVFKRVAHLAKREKLVVGYPAIGAGIAGGDWERISKIISKRMKGTNHTYVEFKP